MRALKMFYAAVGAGDLAVERARRVQVSDISGISGRLPKRINALQSTVTKLGTSAADRSVKTYGDLVKRGERTLRDFRSMNPIKSAQGKSTGKSKSSSQAKRNSAASSEAKSVSSTA